jgi:hypothetical protein
MGTFKVASPIWYKSPFFASNRRIQVVTVKSYPVTFKGCAFVFISYCHFNLWILADGTNTSTPSPHTKLRRGK